MAEKNLQECLTKLAEAQKKEKHQLHQQIIELEKKHCEIQLLELETEKSRRALEIIRTFSEGGDVEAKIRIESLEKNLKEKEEYVEELENLNQVLIVKEKKSNAELQDAQKELINFLKDRPILDDYIGVKRLGYLDYTTIVSAAKKKYSDAEAEEKAMEFVCQFSEKLKDSDWFPFKLRMVGADHEVLKQVIDEEDCYIKAVKNEWDGEAYDAVVTALTELFEYNPSGRFSIPELWNFNEGRSATLAECVGSMARLLKTKKRMRT